MIPRNLRTYIPARGGSLGASSLQSKTVPYTKWSEKLIDNEKCFSDMDIVKNGGEGIKLHCKSFEAVLFYFLMMHKNVPTGVQKEVYRVWIILDNHHI